MKAKRTGARELMKELHSSKELREEIFKELLVHLKGGFSIDSFPPLSSKSINEFVKVYPNEFIQEEIDNALRAGYNSWEEIGYQQSTGRCMGNSRSWFYNMANRYNWSEKAKVESEHSGSVNVNIVNYAKPKAPSQSCEKD